MQTDKAMEEARAVIRKYPQHGINADEPLTEVLAAAFAAKDAEIERLNAALSAADQSRTFHAARAEKAERALAEGVKVKALDRASDNETKIGWTLPTQMLREVAKKVTDDNWDSPTIEVLEIAMLEAERRILSALEPDAPEGAQEAVDWQRVDDALVSCAGLLKVLCRDEIGDTAAAELEYVRSVIGHLAALKGDRNDG